MTTTTTLPLTTRLVAVRLHARRGSGGTPAAARVQTLFDLKQREAARVAESEALRAFVAQARRAVEAVPGLVQQGVDQVAGIAVELGLAVARELVGAALDRGLVDPTPTVARCLRDCVHGSDRADLLVRLNPADLEPVQQRLAAMPELHEELELARFVADATMPRGAVRAETGAGRLRYDPREVLERICDEVRREAAS